MVLVIEDGGFLYYNQVQIADSKRFVAIALFGLYFLILLLQSVQDKYRHYEIYYLQLTLLLMLYLALQSVDFLSLFFSLEGYALCSYILAAAATNNKMLYQYRQAGITLVSEAVIKNFLAGSFFGLIFLIGVCLIYSTTGCLNFSDLELLWLTTNFMNNNDTIIVAFIFIFVALGFKLGVAPLHF